MAIQTELKSIKSNGRDSYSGFTNFEIVIEIRDGDEHVFSAHGRFDAMSIAEVPAIAWKYARKLGIALQEAADSELAELEGPNSGS